MLRILWFQTQSKFLFACCLLHSGYWSSMSLSSWLSSLKNEGCSWFEVCRKRVFEFNWRENTCIQLQESWPSQQPEHSIAHFFLPLNSASIMFTCNVIPINCVLELGVLKNIFSSTRYNPGKTISVFTQPRPNMLILVWFNFLLVMAKKFLNGSFGA